MLMKQSKMQFQEIQISPLDNGGPEQLQQMIIFKQERTALNSEQDSDEKM